MTAEPTSAEAAAASSTWQHLDDLVEDLAGLVRAGLSPQEFWPRLLDQTVNALCAAGGTIWIVQGAERFQAMARVAVDSNLAAKDQSLTARHLRMLAHVSRTELALALPPRSASGIDGDSDNPTPYLLLLSPVVADGQTVAIVEIQRSPGEHPAAAEGYLRLLGAVCELGADYERERQLVALRATAGSWNQLESFTRTLHSSLDVEQVAFTLANDARPLVGCDRISVAVMRGRRPRLFCVSGVDAIDRRGVAVRRLEELIAAVVKVDEPLDYPADAEDLPPQITAALEAALDETHARSLVVLPLHLPSDDNSAASERVVIGAVVCESFTSPATTKSSDPTMAAVAAHGEIALASALAYNRVPLSRLWRALGKSRWLVAQRRWPKVLVATTVALAALTTLMLWPVKLTVKSRGELLPVERREIFAPVDGVVAEVRVAHGDVVAAGQELLVLRRPQLEFERVRLTGEMLTARKRLAALQAGRFGGAAAAADARDQNHQRTAEEEEVKQLLASLVAQSEVLDRQEAELTIRSPIAGQVLTWDVRQLLASRPVNRGQALLSVGDTSGPWELELHVADDRIGHLLSAREATDEPLGVSFMMAMDPDHRYPATVRDIAQSTDAENADEGPRVLVAADVDRESLPRLRPGASVVANIECGHRSFGYVWLHELWDAIFTRFVF